MIRFGRYAVLFALASFVAAPSFGELPGIEVQNAWSRAAPADRTGVIYLTIIDHGAADSLIGAASPVAQKAELHRDIMNQGIMEMRSVPRLPVEPGKPVALAPGGYHIMLLHLKRALVEGDKVPVVLTFEKAGTVSVEATITKAGGSMPAMGQDMHMGR